LTVLLDTYWLKVCRSRKTNFHSV